MVNFSVSSCSSFRATAQKGDDFVRLDALLQVVDERNIRHRDALHGEDVVHRHGGDGFFLGKACVQNLIQDLDCFLVYCQS